jgi:glycosyltransferase involved in cell wall biosynthesis
MVRAAKNLHGKELLIGLHSDRSGGWLTYAQSLESIFKKLGYGVTFMVDNFDGRQITNSRVVSITRGWHSRRYVVDLLVKQLSMARQFQVGINISSEYSGEVFDHLGISIRIATVHSIRRHEVSRMLFSICRPSRIVCVSDNVSIAVKTSLKSADRDIVTRIYPAIIFQQQQGPSSASPKIRSKVLSILFVGRVVVEAKRADLLPKIVAGLESLNCPFHLKILGEGEYLGVLHSELEPQIKAGSVTIAGAVSHDQVMQEMEGADCLILPSDYEGSPHVLLEAMAFGAVPIATNISGSTTPIIDHEINGYLVPNQDEARVAGIVLAVNSLVNDTKLCIEMSNAAKCKYSNTFSTDRIASTWNSLIENCEHQDQSLNPWTNYKKIRLRDQPFVRLLWRHSLKLIKGL